MAATSTLRIVLEFMKKGGADKDAIKSLNDLGNSVKKAGLIFGSLVAASYAVNKALDETVGTFVRYADQVRAVQYATGASAEESSRLIQMADDAKVSYESLMKGMKKAVQEGITPNIEGLAALADQYVGLAPGAERAEFLLDKFGKTGGDLAELMSKGGEGVREMSGAIDASLILTQRGVDTARLYQMQIDKLTDSFEGLKVTIGGAIAGVLTGSEAEIRKNAQAIFEQANGYVYNANMAGRYSQAQRDAWAAAEAQAEAAWASKNGLDAETAAIEEATAAFNDMFTAVGKIQSAQDNYTQALQNERDRREELKAQYAEGKITLEELNAGYQESEAAVRQAAAAHEAATNQIIFDMVRQEMAADGLSKADGAALMQMGVDMGIFEQKSVDAYDHYSDLAAGYVTASKTAGEGIQEGLAPAQETLRETTGRAADLNEQMWNLIQKDGEVVDFYANLHVTGSLAALAQFGGRNCFLPGTQVQMHDGTTKMIEQVVVGDKVASMELDSGKIVEAEVTEVFAHAAEEIEGYLLINHRIGVTREHLLYINGQWAAAETVRVGDYLIGTKGQAVWVTSVWYVEQAMPTYNLHTNHETHNYFADGILAHNVKVGEDMQNYARGGYLGQGWSKVGEAGFELIAPNGYVFTHEQSKALEAAGILPDEALRIGGYMSAAERAYYRTRPRGDVSDLRRARRAAAVSAPAGQGGGSGGGGAAGASGEVAMAAADVAVASQGVQAAIPELVGQQISAQMAVQRAAEEQAAKLDQLIEAQDQFRRELYRTMTALFQQVMT